MRAKKALHNTLMGLFLEVTLAISGLIIPRLILLYFGSTYNGITMSITQFLNVISLLTAGIGGVTRAALYKPLVSGDLDAISAIIKATENHMKKVTIIFATFLAIFSVIYMILVLDDFSWTFSLSLVLIIGLGSYARYLCGLTYQMLLKADQKLYIIFYIQTLTTILNIIIAATLITNGFSIHWVKFGSAIVFLLNPIGINIYIRKKYKLVKNIRPDNHAIKQRWDAFAHKAANFAFVNTNIMLLTIFLDLKEVSVYAVYNAIILSVRKIVMRFSGGMVAAFGNMFAKKEYDLIEKTLSLLEIMTFSSTTILFSSTSFLILPFINIYTQSVQDVDYYRPLFANILILSTVLTCLRIPYQSIVEAIGHFKQTRNGAIFEAILIFLISLVLIQNYGIIGAAIGMLSATLFRTCQFVIYLSKNILQRSIFKFINKCLTSVLAATLIISINHWLLNDEPTTLIMWFVHGLITFSIATLVTLAINYIFHNREMHYFMKKIRGLKKS